MAKLKFVTMLLNIHSEAHLKSIINEAKRLRYAVEPRHSKQLPTTAAFHDSGVLELYYELTAQYIQGCSEGRFQGARIIKRVKNIRNVVESARYHIEFPFVGTLTSYSSEEFKGAMVKFTKLSKDGQALVGTVIESPNGGYKLGYTSSKWARTDQFPGVWKDVMSYDSYLLNASGIYKPTSEHIVDALEHSSMAATNSKDMLHTVLASTPHLSKRHFGCAHDDLLIDEHRWNMIAPYGATKKHWVKPKATNRIVQLTVLAISKVVASIKSVFKFLTGK